MVTVRIYSLLRDRLGEGKVRVEARDVAEAVSRLKETFGSRWTGAVEEGGRVKESYIFLVDGQRIFRDDFPEKRLDDKAVLHIFPPIAGG